MKNSVCNNWTLLFKSDWATTKLMFNTDAPCEIIRILTSRIALNARADTPDVDLIFSPTKLINAFEFSADTSENSRSSLRIESRFAVLSMVSDTLTSDVETTSTGVSKRSKTSKMRRRNPWAINIRLD